MVARLPEQENSCSPRMSMWRAAQLVMVPLIGGDDRVVGEELVQLVRHHLRLHRHVLPGAPLLHQLPPVLHPGLRLLEEGAVRLLLEPRQQQPAACGCCRRPGPPRPGSAGRSLGVEVDLHRPRLAGLRVELDVGEGCCPRSAACRSSRARPARVPCRAARRRRCSRGCRRAGHPCRAAPWRPVPPAARLRPRARLAAPSAPRPARMQIFLPCVQDRRRPRQLVLARHVRALGQRSETCRGTLRCERGVALAAHATACRPAW